MRRNAITPYLYWTTIIATTTVGTTLADFADRSLGIGYTGGTTLLFALLIVSLFVWHRTLGSISVETVNEPKAEMFYWVTIMFSQTLGTLIAWGSTALGLNYGGMSLDRLASSVSNFGFSIPLPALGHVFTWIRISRHHPGDRDPVRYLRPGRGDR